MVSKKNKAKLYELIENYRKATTHHAELSAWERACYEQNYETTKTVEEARATLQKACADLDFFIKHNI